MEENLHIYLTFIWTCGDGCCSELRKDYHGVLSPEQDALIKEWFGGNFNHYETLYFDDWQIEALGLPQRVGGRSVCGIEVMETDSYYCY